MNTIIKLDKIKRVLLLIIECCIVFAFAYFLCKFFNRLQTIKALHKDDLENYIYYLQNPDIKDWIFGQFADRKHYRPIFYIILFKIFKLITGNVEFIMVINFFIASIVATVLYIVTRSLKVNRIMSLIVVTLYIVSPFSYYQIYQAIGCLEAFALMFSIIILCLSINSVFVKDKKKHIYYISLLVLYPLLVFTHERYFPIYLVILLAIIFNKYNSAKFKVIYIIMLSIELVLFFLIRYHFLKIWIPRGTACTDLVANFDLDRSIRFFGMQFMYIFGIHLDEPFLSCISFSEASTSFQVIVIASAISSLLLIIVYLVKKIYIFSLTKLFDFYIDILVLIFILCCIIQSSLTIRLEMRWIYASFSAFIIYLAYIMTYLFNNYTYKYRKIMVLAIVLFTTFVSLRIATSFYYREYYDCWHIVNEQKATNSLAEQTVYKYGIDAIRNTKKIYIVNNVIDFLMDEEYTHFFDPFDGKLSSNKCLFVEEDFDKLQKLIFDDNNIFLGGQTDRTFKRIR